MPVRTTDVESFNFLEFVFHLRFRIEYCQTSRKRLREVVAYESSDHIASLAYCNCRVLSPLTEIFFAY